MSERPTDWRDRYRDCPSGLGDTAWWCIDCERVLFDRRDHEARTHSAMTAAIAAARAALRGECA